METLNPRNKAKFDAITRPVRKATIPANNLGQQQRISQYYGENVFNFQLAKGVPEKAKKELMEVASSGKQLSKELAAIVASAVTDWSISKGVSHFCHWFQPLTGSTAEKHDAFLDIDGGNAIERLSASQLVCGEPDASSFPHGGTRSTFEARGYTAWDIKSPMFIVENSNGKTLCIPTAFVSYHGDALDVKTPLLRSNNKMNKVVTRFLNLIGDSAVKNSYVTCGAEQEYFLVDSSFYNLRPDLVMSGRTLLGSLTPRNQQLEDHYFGVVTDRVLDFMQELEIELYRLGVPAKTRHNEVAPGQFELACIYNEANIAADHNQLVMATLRKVAHKHNFEALIHEKPFSGVNGSGKHINWSLATDTGVNLFSAGKNPATNLRFLALVSAVLETIKRHSGVIRASVSSAGNDHRLGANEAPPSILSVFLGETLTKILEGVREGKNLEDFAATELDMGADQLANIFKDNTDRNRTSPLAFTGDKFEFRAPGSAVPVGFPLSVFNAAFIDVLDDSNDFLEKSIKSGKSADESLLALIKKLYEGALHVVFNGDGYSQEWVDEAERRGLLNLKSTADALSAMRDESQTQFLSKAGVFSPREVQMRHNVFLERYIKLREIEFQTLENLINQYVLPSSFAYKSQLISAIKGQKEIGLNATAESDVLTRLSGYTDTLVASINRMGSMMDDIGGKDEVAQSYQIANELLPLSEEIAGLSNHIENIVPDAMWNLPKYFDMLFLR